ncbi:poly(U)-binding-splicing factor PUF60-like isoform X2 [Hydractinia symbiolongicarpus]|uniref:poly(U)-binding-splicing factor PUF60-like isoform X2 n=1 Tax=Hydractinia symbiolongicarpus TaxID=13093 RepID=UPI00254E062F|nr:poly(U)-binding-splicing factor PUF60-like isoform X2 [Hydractinia symbiolongicarpus]
MTEADMQAENKVSATAMDVDKPTETTTNQEPPAPTKRRRRNMFDVKPEELGVVPKVEALDQPKDDESGELIIGPGSGGLQARFSEAKKALPPIVRDQEERLAQAKRFAMEQSVQHVLAKQKVVQTQDASQLHSSAQRQRALALMCRVYIGSINFQLDEEAVRASFIPFGPIRMIDLSRDSTTGRHKGFAFVEYEIPEAAQLALEQMNNVMMGGRNIKVGRPSNVPQAAPWIEQILEEARQYARIYISSIHPDLTETDIKSVFEAFGTVISCKLSPDQLTGKHKGFGFIEYTTQQAANDAIVAMNLFDLGGQYIRVGKAITPPTSAMAQGPPPAASMLAASAISASIQGQEAVSTHGASALTKNPLNPMLSVSQVATPPTNNQLMTSAASTSVASPVTASVHGINGSTGSPVVSSNGQTSSAMSTMLSSQSSGNQPVPEEKLNARQQRKKQELLDHKHAGEQNLEREEKLEISGKDARYMMMQKLSRGAASGVLVLRNMVGAEEVDEDLEEEVTEECSRFGEVKKVVIYQEKQGEEESAEVIVKIFVEFAKTESAETAQTALHGRWFGGRNIQAQVYDEDKFKAQDYTD